MIRRYLLCSAMCVTLWSCSAQENEQASAPVATESQPNLVFVLADQWRAQDVGYAGNKQVITPHLDELARESVNFTTAVVTMPVCSPARASLMTGQYPLTHGVFYNDKPLPNEAFTLAEAYKAQGYATAYIGKWHLNGHPEGEPHQKYRKLPVPKDRRQGFDYWKVMETTHDYNQSFYYDEDDRKHQWEGYDAEAQTEDAIRYIAEHKDNPFVLFLSWGPPHNPYQTAPEQFRALYADEDAIDLRPNVPDELAAEARHEIAGYYAHIAALDTYIERLQSAIRDSGIESNTIFVFTSDHGDMLHSQGKVRKQKTLG